MSNPTALVQKLWNYCNIQRDGGLSYCDYQESRLNVVDELELVVTANVQRAHLRQTIPQETFTGELP